MLTYPVFEILALSKKVARRRICRGVRLGFLTLGHLRLLEAVQSPFVTGEPITRLDALQLIAIASMRYNVATLLWCNPVAFGAIVTWFALLTIGKDGEVIESLQDWMREQVEMPDRWRTDEELSHPPSMTDEEFASPISMRIFLAVAKLNVCKNPWSMRVTECYAWIIANRENKGDHYLSFETTRMAEGF
jgi:hypothetical protein